MTTPAPQESDGRGPRRLTAREWEVIALLAQSISTRDIGTRLRLDVEIVERDRASALAKLGRSRQPEALRLRVALTRAGA